MSGPVSRQSSTLDSLLSQCRDSIQSVLTPLPTLPCVQHSLGYLRNTASVICCEKKVVIPQVRNAAWLTTFHWCWSMSGTAGLMALFECFLMRSVDDTVPDADEGPLLSLCPRCLDLPCVCHRCALQHVQPSQRGKLQLRHQQQKGANAQAYDASTRGPYRKTKYLEINGKFRQNRRIRPAEPHQTTA